MAGETNVGYPVAYSCQMKQLVKQWRDMFHNGSVGETSLDFPFGYVQVSAQVKRTSTLPGCHTSTRL